MSAPSQADGVRALVEPLARAAGLVIEGITVTPAGRRRVLRVIVDLPEDCTGGVPMEAVGAASQAISAALDDSPVMGGQPYVLEVSSPGADRPLTERRHWLRARGRLVQLIPPAGAKPPWSDAESVGRLTAVTEAGLVLDGAREVSWQNVASGRVEIEFGHPADFDSEIDAAEIDEAEPQLEANESERDEFEIDDREGEG